ncbi:hypothetical protein MMC09_004519 [Bachmanniomyces sp. S44760]|nr:hypothetical protein [Bachmanniomyces sp. S44760]
MARAAILSRPSSEVDRISLSRALSRLQLKILSQNADRQLRRSSYERKKTAAVRTPGHLLQNIEYARTLLLRLEHETSTIKIQSRKHAAQSELLQQRNLIKRLNDRLYELGQLDDGTFSDDSEGSEDLLGVEISPAQPLSTTREAPSAPELDRQKSPPTPPSSPPILRNRRTLATPLTNASDSKVSSSSTSTTTGALTKPPSTSPPPHQQNTTATATATATAKLLEANSSTQSDLTSSLVAMAQTLKSQSLAFQTALEAEKPLLSTTGEALHKNTDGMAAAEKRMGMLRRMSEGRGWYGRIMLYAWIGGLWVVAILLVFVGPKLRF